MEPVAAVALLLLFADAQQAPRVLAGPDIIAALEGKTVSGAYAGGLAFRETYFLGGKIDYWDPRIAEKGQWSVVNNLFCTFYDSMAGGCFRIEQIGNNCFDFYAAANTQEQALKPDEKPRYTARGSRDGESPSCPRDLSS